MKRIHRVEIVCLAGRMRGRSFETCSEGDGGTSAVHVWALGVTLYFEHL